MKINSSCDYTGDHRLLALLAIGLVVVVLHLYQFSPFANKANSDLRPDVSFVWLTSQAYGEGLYRISKEPDGSEVIPSGNVPNRLRYLLFRPVSINKADRQMLALLPGIGKTLASRIVDYREAHGDIRSPFDLLGVDGIGPAKLEKLEKLLVYD